MGSLGYKTITADVEIDLDDIVAELDEDQLSDALAKKRDGITEKQKLELIYEEFRRRGDAPQILRDYLYDMLGRTLP